MKNTVSIILASLAIMWTSSCVNVGIDNDQPTQVPTASTVTNMKQFVDVNVVGSMQVFFTQGNKHTVKVQASKEAFDKLVIYVKENELYISSKNENIISEVLASMQNVKVFVTSPSLREVSVTGAGTFTTSDQINVSHLDIDITGSGNVNFTGNIKTKTLDVELTGSGNVNIENLNSPKLNTTVTGSGNVNYANINVERAQSTITGTGNITMKGTVAEHIKSTTGSGKIATSL